jgi:hypothetical protein
LKRRENTVPAFEKFNLRLQVGRIIKNTAGHVEYQNRGVLDDVVLLLLPPSMTLNPRFKTKRKGRG